MQKVLILGATGMLGHACKEILEKTDKYEVVNTSRLNKPGYLTFDAVVDNPEALISQINPDWIVNCIGIIKPHINENSVESISNAINVNSIFPAKLSSATPKPIIQIATDCVYSGAKGGYVESDFHDATDVYGKTKSLGEMPAENLIHLRASIIGPEVGRSTSLLEWFLNQPNGATLNGFTNHMWNGVTTHHFGMLAEGIISNNYLSIKKTHVIPGNELSKADLLRAFSLSYKRQDLIINNVESKVEINRTLKTENDQLNIDLWNMAGFNTPPTVEEMVDQQSQIASSKP